MKNLTATLTAKQKEPFRSPYIRLTFSLTGESDVVIEQDRILEVPSQEEADDSQTVEIVFKNADGYFTSLDLKGWAVVMEWGMSTTAGIEYSALPPFKVIDQNLTSSRGVLRCSMKFIGIPDLLALDKASADYKHHWSDIKTVKTLIGEIASRGGTLTNLTGTATGSPISLVAGTNTVIVTADGTFTIVLPAGSIGRAISGTATVTSSPVALVGGSQTITVSGGGAGKTITIMAIDTELTEEQTVVGGGDRGTLTNLAGTATGSPIDLTAGVNIIDVTAAGTFTIVLPIGSAGTAASGTATVTGSPVALGDGSQTITVTGTGTIIITIETSYRLDDTLDGIGQLMSISSRTINKISFKLNRTTVYVARNVTFRLESVSSGILASGTFSVASIGTDFAWCEVTLATPILVNEAIDYYASGVLSNGIWLLCLDAGGSATDYVSVCCSGDEKPDEYLVKIPHGGSPPTNPKTQSDYMMEDQDCAYRYKYIETGVDVFSHCTSYDVVFDSEDSLIDTYAPADGFRIDEGSSRLESINALLRFTGCVKRVQADGKIHVLVPKASTDIAWVSPTSSTDADSAWTDDALAYDGNTATYAYVSTVEHYLELIPAVSLYADTVRIWADSTTALGTPRGVVTLTIEVYYNSAWHVLNSAQFTGGEWVTFNVGGIKWVEKARLKIPTGGASTGESRVMEFAFYQTYDYEYALGSGNHEFFSKSVRNALVIPNKVTVHSYPDDDTIYSGYYTDTTSFALVPKEDFIRTKLTSSAQATAIATAMIGQAVMNSQRGSATVPINLGAEIWDFVKVTDSRQSDSRTGNIGYLKRWYMPGRDLNMGFSFGKLAITGTGGFRVPQGPKYKRRDKEIYVFAEDYYLDQDENNDKRDAIAEKLNIDIIPNLNNLIRKNNYRDDEDPTSTQIDNALIGYLKNLVEDKNPYLGADLDTNGKTINLYFGGAKIGTLTADANGIYLTSVGNNKTVGLSSTGTGSKILLNTGEPIDCNTQKISNVVDPASNQDAATKKYVDDKDTTLTNATPSRVIDYPYQNASGRRLLLTITVEITLANQSAELRINSSSSLTTVIGIISSVALGKYSISAEVPVNYWYGIISTAGAPSIASWNEATIGG